MFTFLNHLYIRYTILWFIHIFNYCIIVWGSTYRTNLNRIVLLQKRLRAVRIVSKEAFDAHTDPVFQELKILKFEKNYLLHLGKFMYSHKNNLLPRSFYQGPKFFNTLNQNIRDASTASCFQYKLNNYLLLSL